MSLSAQPNQAFEVPVITVLNNRQRVSRWILITSVVLFLVTANYIVYFSNFLALEFSAGQVYTSVGFWKLWANVFKLLYLAIGFFAVSQLRTTLSTLWLNIGFFLTIVFIIYDLICSVFYLLKLPKCDDVLCYLEAGGAGKVGTPTTQFTILIVTTSLSLVLGAVVIFGITRLRERVDAARSQLEQVAEAEAFAPPLTANPEDVSAMGSSALVSPGLSTSTPLVDPSLPPNDPRQPFNRPGLTPAAVRALMNAQRATTRSSQGPTRTTIVEVLQANRSLRNLAFGTDLAIFLLAALYLVYIGNFLALEFNAGEPYSSFIWFSLWFNVPLKIFFLAFASFVVGRAQVSRSTRFMSVTSIVSAVMVVYDFFTLILLILELADCDGDVFSSPFCYGEAGGLGTPGMVTSQFWILLATQSGQLLLHIVLVIAFNGLVNAIRVRNSTTIRNVAASRLQVGRGLRRFGITFRSTVGDQLPSDPLSMSADHSSSSLSVDVDDPDAAFTPSSSVAYHQHEGDMFGDGVRFFDSACESPDPSTTVDAYGSDDQELAESSRRRVQRLDEHNSRHEKGS